MNSDNTNLQNNEDNLNSVSLGSIGSVNVNNEVPSQSTIDAPNNVSEPEPELFDIPVNIPANNSGPSSIPNESVVQNTSGATEPVPTPIPTELPSDLGSVPIDNVDSNAFVETQKVENIGVEPPKKEEPKKKKMNKTLFFILIIVLIFAVAGGVMFLLQQGQQGGSLSSISVVTKTVSLSLGDKPSTEITDYATFNGTSATNCQLDTTAVKSNTAGTYEFVITCGSNTYKGNVIVEDTVPPVVGLNVVYASPDANGVYNVELDDFVEDCVDPSECSLSFTDEATLKSNLEKVGGPYIVGINAVDKIGNSTVVNAEMYVLESAPAAIIGSSSASAVVTEANATKTTTDIFAIGNANGTIGYMGAARREITYKFNTETSYKEIAATKNYNLTLDGYTGLAKYDDKDLTIKISTDLNMDTLSKESGGTFNTEYLAIKEMYETNGYKCEVINK